MGERRIGTVDLPERMDRAHYFGELNYLELSALFAGPLKAGVLAKWAHQTPRGGSGLHVPWVLTHRQPPRAPQLWAHDASVGDFRESGLGRIALGQLKDAIDKLGATYAIFKSPPLFAPSTAHRDQMKQFFGEVATPETTGAQRVWVPDGLWEPRTAAAFARELGIVCALDPLVREPGQPLELFFELDLPELYFRVSGLGEGGPIRSEKQEDLVALVEHYEGLPLTIVFESPSRWQDARNLKKFLEGAVMD
jgi:hypothetical protein